MSAAVKNIANEAKAGLKVMKELEGGHSPLDAFSTAYEESENTEPFEADLGTPRLYLRDSRPTSVRRDRGPHKSLGGFDS